MVDFICDKCGLCCESLNENEMYADLNDGTGTCRYYDKDTHLCTIYNSRPLKCNVVEAYTGLGFDKLMSYEDYLEMNSNACKDLKRRRHL